MLNRNDAQLVENPSYIHVPPRQDFPGEVGCLSQSQPGDTRLRFRGVVDERAQGAQPGFVAFPARDGGAIDRLPGLPLAGGPHSPRIGFGAQARGVPRQAAGRDNPPDDWFGLAGQVLVIDFDEAIGR